MLLFTTREVYHRICVNKLGWGSQMMRAPTKKMSNFFITRLYCVWFVKDTAIPKFNINTKNAIQITNLSSKIIPK